MSESTAIIPLRRRGFCHVFGDHVPLDEGVMAFKFAIGRVTDPEVLIPHLFELIDPEFVQRVKPGDFVVAGQDFGCGKPHGTGFIAMHALGMGVLCESMPSRALRGAVTKGLPVLADCSGVTAFVRQGDELEVDFGSGEVRNLTQGTQAAYPGMSPVLREIVEAGGVTGTLRKWLQAHPEQRAQAPQQPLEGLPAGMAPITFAKGAGA